METKAKVLALTQEKIDHAADLERLKAFRPLDDTFMRCLFRNNIPLAEMVLRIIIGKQDLAVISCETQADLKRVTGARSICLDAYATDSQHKKYDIEMQRADTGADPHRARYHASSLDVENLDAGQKFVMLPDTYIILITENDYFEKGKPVYWIQRVNQTTGEIFDDGSHILYVNGEYQDDTSDIGKLMHDFRCNNAGDMYFPLLANRTRYFKETQKGVEEMCKIMEETREEGIARGIAQGRLETTVKYYRKGAISAEEAAKDLGMTVEEFRKKAAEIA